MDIEQLWEKAKEKTEVVRGRIKSLSTFNPTEVPYIFLGESCVNEGNTVVRKGRVVIERPMILLPEDLPQFDGFEFEEQMDIDQGTLQMFFIMRGMRFPSLKYNNNVDALDLDEQSLSKCIKKYKQRLEKEENVSAALVIGPEDCWQFSVLIYMASLAGKNIRTDLSNILDKFSEDR